MSSSFNEFIVSEDSHSINIKINIDRLDYNTFSSFRTAFSGKSIGSRYKIDFSKVNFMDSSALGMLLVLREYNGINNKLIEFVNCSKDVVNILKIAGFDRMFDIKSLDYTSVR
jgi:HptB-dependent secretion and biofilm anti anti-sigma factor